MWYRGLSAEVYDPALVKPVSPSVHPSHDPLGLDAKTKMLSLSFGALRGDGGETGPLDPRGGTTPDHDHGGGAK